MQLPFHCSFFFPFDCYWYFSRLQRKDPKPEALNSSTKHAFSSKGYVTSSRRQAGHSSHPQISGHGLWFRVVGCSYSGFEVWDLSPWFPVQGFGRSPCKAQAQLASAGIRARNLSLEVPSISGWRSLASSLLRTASAFASSNRNGRHTHATCYNSSLFKDPKEPPIRTSIFVSPSGYPPPRRF